MKERLLPESHSDFVLTAEPIGVAFGLLLIAVFAFIVMRLAARSGRTPRR